MGSCIAGVLPRRNGAVRPACAALHAGSPRRVVWVVPPAALEVVAVVLANRSLQPDPKGGPWHWLAVTALVLPLILMLLPLIGLALLIVNLSQTN